MPLSSACSASPPPLYTMVSSFGRFSRTFSTSAWMLRRGADRRRRDVGLLRTALASATNSFTVLAGNSERTTKVFGEEASSHTPTKSL